MQYSSKLYYFIINIFNVNLPSQFIINVYTQIISGSERLSIGQDIVKSLCMGVNFLTHPV